MKTQIIGLLLALAATFAVTAGATLPATPLAKLVISGGMPGEGFLASRTIIVLENGLVNLDEYYYNEDFNSTKPGKEIHIALAKMDASDLAILNVQVALLRGGSFKSSKEPMCEDAPGYSYTVFKNGQEIEIFKNVGCVDFSLKSRSQRAHAAIVKKYLDQLDQLNQ